MINILRIAYLITAFLFTDNCKTTAKKPSNVAVFDKNLYLYERLSDEKIASISNDITIRFFDQYQHGNQIEFNSNSGITFLWYPNNKNLVSGFYKIKDNRVICFNYSGIARNEFTGEFSGNWNCQDLLSYYNKVREKIKGNVFNLNESKAIPFTLERFPEQTILELNQKSDRL
ncbi:MAG: hypothetical protein SH817_10545 [Leptospira sp.]|nr:hypothetical protein [Leptospira sp.]